jgi:hypothetical protein
MPKWHRGMEPKTPKEKFNRIHSSIRNIIERSFDVLKMKWQILYKMLNYPMWKQKMVVIACMILHNFIHEHGSEDLGFARFDCVMVLLWKPMPPLWIYSVMTPRLLLLLGTSMQWKTSPHLSFC